MTHTQMIKQFVLDEFLPGLPAGELTTDYDLVAAGVIDSLGLLKLIAWLEDRFRLPTDELELDPDSFRSIEAIDAFVTAATRPATAS
jgi:acyl carrier protein